MTGEVISADENSIKFKSPTSPDILLFDQSKLNIVTFLNSEQPQLTKDNIVLINGDVLPCHINNVDVKHVNLSLFGEETTIPLEKISALFFDATRDTSLITGPQSLKRKILNPPPLVPSPFFSNMEEEKQTDDKKPNISNPFWEKPSEEQLSMSRDSWEGTGTTGWRWLGNEEKSSLEISSNRGIMSKVFPLLTARFTLSGSYSGTPSGAGRNDSTFSTDPTIQARGINFLFGATPEDHRNYFSPYGNTIAGFVGGGILSSEGNPPKQNSFYSLALFPTEVVLFKYSPSKTYFTGRTIHILLHHKLNSKHNKSYDFKLISRGMEFRLFIDNEQIASVYDNTPHNVNPGTFSLFNGSHIPVILKDLKLVSHLKTNERFLPSPETKLTVPVLIMNDGNNIPGELVNYTPEKNSLVWKLKDSSSPPLSFLTNSFRVLYVHKIVPDEASLYMKFDDGELIKGQIKTLDDKEFIFTHPLLGELKIPRNYINRIEYYHNKPS